MQLFVSFKRLIFVKASSIWLNNSCFTGWLKSKPLIHLGKEKLTWLTGNSYKILEKILLISDISSSAQFIGKTVELYFSARVEARLIVSEFSGCSEFKSIIKGLFIAFNSETTLSSAET